MICGLGNDVVHIKRIQQALDRYGEQFLQRILSTYEIALYHTYPLPRQAEFVAGRFAAKEAIAKALGCGLARLKAPSVDIHLTARGLAVTWLHGSPSHVLPHDTVLVSISHSEDVAFATAIWDRVDHFRQ